MMITRKCLSQLNERLYVGFISFNPFYHWVRVTVVSILFACRSPQTPQTRFAVLGNSSIFQIEPLCASLLAVSSLVWVIEIREKGSVILIWTEKPLLKKNLPNLWVFNMDLRSRGIVVGQESIKIHFLIGKARYCIIFRVVPRWSIHLPFHKTRTVVYMNVLSHVQEDILNAERVSSYLRILR